jgi:hypothetical protein
MTPDYLICLECECPVYVFEWKGGQVKEAICEMCGNEDPQQFATEEEYEDLSLDRRFDRAQKESSEGSDDS